MPEDQNQQNLYQQESQIPSTEDSATDSPQESQAIDSLYNPTSDKNGKRSIANFRITPLQKKLGIGGTILTVLIVGLASISTGPLQFIHLGQLMQRFHHSSMDDLTEARLGKTTRYLRSRSIQDTRLGVIANAYAKRIEVKMEKAGIKIEYDQLGHVQNRVYDLKKLRASGIGNTIPKSDADFVREMEELFGRGSVTITGDNKFRVKEPDLGVLSLKKYLLLKRLNKLHLKAANYDSKTFTALASRTLRKRMDLTYHPIRRIDRKINEKTLDMASRLWKEIKTYTRGGAEGGFTSVVDKDKRPTDPDTGQQIEPNDEAIKAAEEGIPEIQQDAKADADNIGTNAKADTSKLAIKFRQGAGIVMITSLVCIVQAMAEKIDEINSLNILVPMARFGMYMTSVGSQAMSNQDIDMETLGALSEKLFDKKTGSWINAKSVQAQLGNTDKGIAHPPEAPLTLEENPVTQLLNKISGLVDTICSATFQGAVTVFSFFIAPVGTAVEEVVMRSFGNDFLGRKMNALAGYLANEPLDVSKFAGGEMGSLIDAGNFLAANEIAKSNGGRPLSKSETSLIIERQNAYIAQDYKNKSIYDKYLNIMDANTPVAMFIDNQSPSVGENLARLPSKLVSLTGSIVKNVTLIGSTKSYAATNYYDYGLPRIGFSNNEIDNQKLKNPIENADKAAELIKGPNGEDYKNFFRSCYGLEIANDLSSQPITDAPIIYQGKNGILEMKISIAGNNIKCSEPTNEELLRIRMAVFDTQRMEGLACYEGDEEACRNITNMDIYTQTNNEQSLILAAQKATQNNIENSETMPFLFIKNNSLLQSIYRSIYKSFIGHSYSFNSLDSTLYAYRSIATYV